MVDAELLPTPASGVDPELPRRRDARPGVQRRPVPWLVILGVLLLLVLVGRGLVGAVLGRAATTSTALVTVGPAPTAGGSVAPSEPAATGSGGSALIVPTVAPTPPPSSDRLILPLASPSATTTSSPTSPAPSSPTAPAPVTGPRFVGVQSGRCIDVMGGSTADFTRMELYTCNGSAAQAITYTSASELRVLGKCVDAQGQSTSDGTAIILYACNGQLNQKWTLGPGGTIRGVQSNRCLEAAFQGRSDGTPLQLWTCTGTANQAWSR
jgi:hypothetical protein